MQSTWVPKGIVSRLETLCRYFFWEQSYESRDFHMVLWKKLCSPKPAGGLDFPDLAVTNRTLVCKLILLILTQPQELSSQVLIDKYGDWATLLLRTRILNLSPVWRVLRTSFPLFQWGIRWLLGDSSGILFWLDNWCGKTPLIASTTGVLDHVWNPNEGWDVQLLTKYHPSTALHPVLQHMPLDQGMRSDKPFLRLTTTSDFSTTSIVR